MAMSEQSNPSDHNQGHKLILVAEDSSITQDLLKLVLNQRGHEVHLVDDGAEALDALQKNNYDIALVDFHLPEMDGLEVVSSYYELNRGEHRPYFVAITADIEGLLQHEKNCEKFDKILPKPVDIQEVCSVIDTAQVEDAHQYSDYSLATNTNSDASLHPNEVQSGEREIASSPVLSMDFDFLCWPEDLSSKHISTHALHALLSQKTIDGIVIKEPASYSDLTVLWQTKGLHLLPIIDLTGTLGKMADLDCSALGFSELDQVTALVESFHDRRAYIHRDVLYSDDMRDKILARIFISNEGLEPTYDVCSKLLISYNISLDPQFVANEAQKILESGFLSPSFFDRVYECTNCGSAHFNVREECPQCRSSHLRDESYLHHFRCAYQGPEIDFRQGDDLVCPKCRREVGHFGRDYDRPGTMVVCETCGHTTSEPSVGFKCLSCSSHIDGDAIDTRDIHSYTLTEQASGFIEAGKAFLGFAQQSLRFSELPLELVVSLNEEAKRYNEGGIGFALLDISYQNEREIVREHGPRQFNDARKIALENLHSYLSDDAKIVKGHAYDFALLKNTDPDEVRNDLEKLTESTVNEIRLDLGLSIAVFGPEDLSG